MSDFINIPVTPPLGLLESMAMRLNHAYGISKGLTDEQIEGLRNSNPIYCHTLLTSREREALLTEMRQIHEEVVGKGFYKYE